jgi:hypothetical protein
MASPAIPRPIRLLFACDILIAMMYVANRLSGTPFVKVNRLLDLNGEANLPTWFSSMQWAAAAGLLAFVFLRRHERRAAAVFATLGVSLLFLLLSVDEVAQIHEKLSIGISGKLGAGQGRFKGMWLPALGLPVLAVLGLLAVQMKSMFDAAPGSLRAFTTGLVVFGVGAFGIEPVLNLLNQRSGPSLVLFEETLEMVGVTFLVWASFAVAASEGLLAFQHHEPRVRPGRTLFGSRGLRVED